MSYFKLALALTKQYVTTTIVPTISTVLSTEKHVQWLADHITITISELSPFKTLINFVDGEITESITMDWTSFDVLPQDKPSSELQERFNVYMDLKLNRSGKVATQRPVKDQEDRERGPQPGILFDTRPQLESATSRPPDMPDFDDEYEIKGRYPGEPQGGRVPLIGDRDLNPPGLPRDPLMKPYVDPLAQNPDGGMYPSSDHPMFGRREGNTSRRGVPPGARFDDPYGEDNLEDMGMGLPGNLRHGGLNPRGGPGGSGFGGSGLGGPGSGGSGFGF